MAEEREVVARLKVQKEGETGAFKETAEEVQNLSEAASNAAPNLEKLGDAAGDGGGAAKSVSDLGGAAASTFPKLASLSVQAAAVFAAFKTGIEIGNNLKEVLNDLTAGGLDRQLQKDATSVINFFTNLDETGDAALRLQNGLNILRKSGIDPTGKSAEEVAALVEKLSLANRDSAQIAEDAGAAYREQAEALGLSGPKLDEATEKLVNFAREFERQNQQLSKQDLGKIFEPMVQDILDAYAKLGVDPPRRVQVLAESWGILTTAARKAADEHSRIVDKMVEDITGAAAGLKGSLETQLKTLNDVFSKLNFGNLGADQIEKAKTFLQQYVDLSLKAGQQIPKDVADQAAALGILVPAMNVASGAASSFAGHQTDLADKTVHTTQVFDAHGKELSRIATVSDTAGNAAKAAGTKIKEGADEAGKGKKPLDEIAGVIHTAKGDFEIAATSAKTMGEAVKSGSEKAGEGAEALKQTGKAGGEAGTGLAAAKTGATGLGEAASTAATGIGSLKTDLGGLGAAATPAATALAGVKSAAAEINGIKLSAFIAELKAVEVQAKATKAAVDAIDNSSGAAPAEPSAPSAPPGETAPTGPTGPGAGADSGGGGGGGF